MARPVITDRFKDLDKMDGPAYSIVYKDVINVNAFLGWLHQFLVDSKWASPDDYLFREDFYLQRDSPRSGKSIQIRWRLQKTPDKTELYRHDMDIDIDLRGIQDVELLNKGKKVTIERGELEIAVRSWLVKDPKGTWGNEKFWLSKYKKVIFGKVLKKKIGAQMGELGKGAIGLQNALKDYLKPATFIK